MTVTTLDDVTHAIMEHGAHVGDINNTAWKCCNPWFRVRLREIIIWRRGKPQSDGSVDCMACLVGVARCAG